MSVVVCQRISGKTVRKQINNVDVNSKVCAFKMKVADTFGANIKEFELIFCGHCLQNDKTLESYGVKCGVTIHIMKSWKTDPVKTEPLSKETVHQVMTSLESALLNPAYRNTVEQMLGNPETMENIIAATPGLEQDPVAMAMLQDPDLLAMLTDPSNIHKVIEAHPALGEAAMHLAAAVLEEGTMLTASRGRSARGTYSLDHMSDDEEMDTTSQPITTSQLAAALATAQGNPAESSSATAPSHGSAETSSSLSGISSNFFQHAMEQAQSATTQTQLEHMRDMGITDETVARRALEATGGNLQAALELIFGNM